MATYKAEFMSHYYKGRLRPLPAYTMGMIDVWARLGARAPRIANLMMNNPLARRLAHIAPQRVMPHFARKTFRERFENARVTAPAGARRVMLWPDTFNNHFSPDTAVSAAEVLQRAGYEVILPKAGLCCGRPLYDWGFLDRAKKLLRNTMNALAPELESGTPIIGLEPSCVSVFRDELLNLYPKDPRAQQLAKSAMTFSEFIAAEGERFPLPRLERKAIVQAHCHHKAIMKFDAEERVLRQIGLDLEHPDSGCCGMAGAFGFEQKNYELSLNIGERVILPKVRQSAGDTLIIANGFSCREQIEQTTGRKTLHFAEVLRMAMS
jgi:Fe-S oxidoreductase